MSNVSIIKNSFFQRVFSSRAINVDDKQKILNNLCKKGSIEDSIKFFDEFNKLMTSKDKTPEKNNLIQESIRILITSCGYDIGITASITVAIIYHLSKISKSTRSDIPFIEEKLNKYLNLSKCNFNQIIKYINQMKKNINPEYTSKIYLYESIVLNKYVIEYPEELQHKEEYFSEYNEYRDYQEHKFIFDEQSSCNDLNYKNNISNFKDVNMMNNITSVKKHLETHNSTNGLTWKENKQQASLAIYNYINTELKKFSIDYSSTLRKKNEKTSEIKKINKTLEVVLEGLQELFNSGATESLPEFDDLDKEIKDKLNKKTYNDLTGNSDESKELSEKLLKNLKIIVTHKNTDGIFNNSNTKTRWFASSSNKYNIRTDTHEKIRQAIINNKDYEQLPIIKGLIKEESSKSIEELKDSASKVATQNELKEIGSNFNIVETKVQSEPFGLINFGNDCFINSAIQFILNNEILINAVLNHPDKEIKSLFKEMFSSRGEKNVSKRLIGKIRQIAHIQLSTQDSTPLVLNTLFDSHKFILSKAVHKNDDLNLNKYDIFKNLDANKKGIDLLKEAIKNIPFINEEGFIKSAEYDILKNFVLNNNQLGSFKQLFDNKNFVEFKKNINLPLLQKLLHHEEFQQKINGSKFLWFDSSNYGSTSNKNEGVVLGTSLKWSEISNNENVNAIVVHSGSEVNRGHYFAYIKKGNQWYKCNDAKISKISNIEKETQHKRIVAFSYEHKKYATIENDAFKYEGEINEKGEMYGRGKIFWKDTQHTYIGEFKNDCPCGNGVLYKNYSIFNVIYKMTGDKKSEVREEINML